MKLNVFSFECDVTTTCQNRCVGCNHWSPLREPDCVTPSELARDLRDLAQIADADKFVVLGGEPTLHPQLAEILRVIRASGIAPVIEMWTNGQRLDTMPDAVWRSVDSIVADFYPGKVSAERQAAIADKAERMGVAFEAMKVAQFYKNHIREPRADTVTYFNACPYADHCFSIRHGHLFRCPQSSAIPKLLLGLDEYVDGIALNGLTAEGLQGFLKSTEPRKSCAVCSRYDEYADWHEAARGEWLEESLG